MARWIVIPFTEPGRLWMTKRNVVASTLSISELIAMYLGDGTEQDGPPPDSGTQTPEISNCSQTRRFFGNKLTDGLMEIANKHAADNPDKHTTTIFGFFADRAVEGDDKESKTITQTLSCTSPRWNVKYLTRLIKNGFGPRLNKVVIIVDGNELEMRYNKTLLFRSEVKAAETLIPYAVCAAKKRWLRLLERQVTNEYQQSGAMHTIPVKRRATYENMLKYDDAAQLAANDLTGHTVAKARRQIWDIFKARTLCDFNYIPSEELSADWKKELTDELVRYWLDESTRYNSSHLVDFKCSTSPDQVNRIEATVYLQNIKNYVCSQLRERTSPADDTPVFIRMASQPCDHFLSRYDGPSSHYSIIMQNPGEREESRWITISDDPAGSKPRRVLICQNSNFTASLSDFLKTTDIGQFASLKGYERVEIGNSGFLLSSNSQLPDLSIICPEQLAINLRAEGSGSPMDESVHSAPTQSECVEPDLLSGMSLTDGLMEIANTNVAENADKNTKTIFKFFGDRAVEGVDGKSKIITQTLSCTNPQWNIKYLTTAIENGFGPRLDKVEIIVDGNELEMRYNKKSLFRSKVEAAKSLIPYAVRAARNRWLTILQRGLLDEHAKDAKNKSRRKQVCLAKLRIQLDSKLLEIEETAVEAEATRRIKGVIEEPDSKRKLLSDDFSNDWGKGLTEELVQYWLGWIIEGGKAVVWCSTSPAEDAKVFMAIRNIRDYVCARLRERTSRVNGKPVIIRIAEKLDYNFLTSCDGPSGHDSRIMQNTRGDEGGWISISDYGAGPGPRRVLICQPSNFTASLSDFLDTDDPGQV